MSARVIRFADGSTMRATAHVKIIDRMGTAPSIVPSRGEYPCGLALDALAVTLPHATAAGQSAYVLHCGTWKRVAEVTA